MRNTAELLGLLLLATPAAQAGVDFVSDTEYTTDGAPLGVVIADMDADGVADLVTFDATGYQLVVHYGDDSSTRAYALTGRPAAVLALQVDGSGGVDLVAVQPDEDRLAVLLDGSGDVSSELALTTGDFPIAIAAGQLNADGSPDLVVANADDDSISVFFSDGAGGFAAASNLVAGNFPVAVVVTDIDDDSDDDVLVLNMMGNSVSQWLGAGDGSLVLRAEDDLAAGGSLVGGSSLPIAMAVIDVDSDDLPDLVVGSLLDSNLRLYRATGSGFALDSALTADWGDMGVALSVDTDFDDTAADIDLAFSHDGGPSDVLPGLLAVTDVDLDGQEDLLAFEMNGEVIRLFRGNGSGLSGPISYDKDQAGFTYAVGDISGVDLRPDIALGSGSEGKVVVLANASVTGWPPTAEETTFSMDACTSADTILSASDDDGDSISYSIDSVVSSNSSTSSLDTGSGTITIGDVDSGVGGGVTSVSGELVVSDLDATTGALTLVAGPAGHDITWEVNFLATDSSGLESSGVLRVDVHGDDTTGGCSITIGPGGIIVVSPGDIVLSPADGNSDANDSDDDSSGNDDGLVNAPLDVERTSPESGGGAIAWLLLLLCPAIRIRRVS